MVLAKPNSPSSVATALEVLFLLTGGLLGFYAFLLNGIGSSDVRNVWSEKCSCAHELSDGIVKSVRGKYKARAVGEIELAEQKGRSQSHTTPAHEKNLEEDKMAVESDEQKVDHDVEIEV